MLAYDGLRVCLSSNGHVYRTSVMVLTVYSLFSRERMTGGKRKAQEDFRLVVGHKMFATEVDLSALCHKGRPGKFVLPRRGLSWGPTVPLRETNRSFIVHTAGLLSYQTSSPMHKS